MQVFVQLTKREIPSGRDVAAGERLTVGETLVKMRHMRLLHVLDLLATERVVEFVVLHAGEQNAQLLQTWHLGGTVGFAAHIVADTQRKQGLEGNLLEGLGSAELLEDGVQAHLGGKSKVERIIGIEDSLVKCFLDTYFELFYINTGINEKVRLLISALAFFPSDVAVHE